MPLCSYATGPGVLYKILEVPLRSPSCYIVLITNTWTSDMYSRSCDLPSYVPPHVGELYAFDMTYSSAIYNYSFFFIDSEVTYDLDMNLFVYGDCGCAGVDGIQKALNFLAIHNNTDGGFLYIHLNAIALESEENSSYFRGYQVSASIQSAFKRGRSHQSTTISIFSICGRQIKFSFAGWEQVILMIL